MPLSAQRITEGTAKSGDNEFVIKRSNNRLIVANKKNGLLKTSNEIPDELKKLGISSFLTYNQDEANQVLSIIKDDFKKRGKIIPSERPLGVFYVGKNGNILEMDFIISENSILTADDISAMEVALKKDYRFKTKEAKLGNAKYVIWNTVLRLDEIASK
ncbi:hypothetical protein GCM10007423_39330 [Dyadobacter endophyticus]|uniref:Uncharacterized protein n=1 Tax=Dyadobacter endophyticus TaxID=1749036 RepID=A0ABQ1YXN3_9BACT|nr:hypothetical protein GCM10007423_39330 [Dyadobacter endophyticus]